MEKALLIGIITQDQPEKAANESIEELEFLALTAGAKTKKKVLQKMLKQNFQIITILNSVLKMHI